MCLWLRNKIISSVSIVLYLGTYILLRKYSFEPKAHYKRFRICHRPGTYQTDLLPISSLVLLKLYYPLACNVRGSFHTMARFLNDNKFLLYFACVTMHNALMKTVLKENMNGISLNKLQTVFAHCK